MALGSEKRYSAMPLFPSPTKHAIVIMILRVLEREAES